MAARRRPAVGPDHKGASARPGDSVTPTTSAGREGSTESPAQPRATRRPGCRAGAAPTFPGCRLPSQKFLGFRSSAALCVRGDGAQGTSKHSRRPVPVPGPPPGRGVGARVPRGPAGDGARGAGERRGMMGGMMGAGLGWSGGKSCFPGNPEARLGFPRPATALPRPANLRRGRGRTHLGQASPVLGVLPAQHLLQLVHPGPSAPPPVARLCPRPFRVRRPRGPRLPAPRPGACPPGPDPRRRPARRAARLRPA